MQFEDNLKKQTDKISSGDLTTSQSSQMLTLPTIPQAKKGLNNKEMQLDKRPIKSISELNKTAKQDIKEKRNLALTNDPQNEIGKQLLKQKFNIPSNLPNPIRSIGKSKPGTLFSSKGS